MKAGVFALSSAEVEALGYALDLAHDDQKHWSDFGDPQQDYGADWPVTRAIKAAQYRMLGEVGEKLGFHGERARWRGLARSLPPVVKA